MDLSDSDPMPPRRLKLDNLPLGDSSVPADTNGPQQAASSPERRDQEVAAWDPLRPLFDKTEMESCP